MRVEPGPPEEELHGFAVDAERDPQRLEPVPQRHRHRVAAVEGDHAAWYVEGVASERLIRWIPRVLGMIPVVAILLGVLGAAVETRYAMRLEPGLPLQFVLLSLGGWFTLGFVVLVMVERRNFVERFLNSPRQSQAVVVVCAAATSIVFLFLVLMFGRG